MTATQARENAVCMRYVRQVRRHARHYRWQKCRLEQKILDSLILALKNLTGKLIKNSFRRYNFGRLVERLIYGTIAVQPFH